MEKCGRGKGRPQGCSLRSHRRRRLRPCPALFPSLYAPPCRLCIAVALGVETAMRKTLRALARPVDVARALKRVEGQHVRANPGRNAELADRRHAEICTVGNLDVTGLTVEQQSRITCRHKSLTGGVGSYCALKQEKSALGYASRVDAIEPLAKRGVTYDNAGAGLNLSRFIVNIELRWRTVNSLPRSTPFRVQSRPFLDEGISLPLLQ